MTNIRATKRIFYGCIINLILLAAAAGVLIYMTGGQVPMAPMILLILASVLLLCKLYSRYTQFECYIELGKDSMTVNLGPFQKAFTVTSDELHQLDVGRGNMILRYKTGEEKLLLTSFVDGRDNIKICDLFDNAGVEVRVQVKTKRGTHNE